MEWNGWIGWVWFWCLRGSHKPRTRHTAFDSDLVVRAGVDGNDVVVVVVVVAGAELRRGDFVCSLMALALGGVGGVMMLMMM